MDLIIPEQTIVKPAQKCRVLMLERDFDAQTVKIYISFDDASGPQVFEKDYSWATLSDADIMKNLTNGSDPALPAFQASVDLAK